MKRLLIVVAAVMACAFASETLTTEEIMSKVVDAPARGAVIDCSFSETRTPAKGTPFTLKGRLEYKPDNYLSMSYDNGELFLIDGMKMTIRRDGKENVFDLNKNLMMKSLSHALLYSFRGTLVTLAEEQNTLIEAVYDGKGQCVVTLRATKTAARGYSCIVVYYDARTYAIKSMRMDEFTGASTYYTM